MKRGDRLDLGHGPVVVVGRKRMASWLAARRRGITATDVPAIMGWNDYRTPMAVWADKTGRAEPDDLDGSYPVHRGYALEPLLLSWWAHDAERTLIPTPALIAHPSMPWLMCSLDGLGMDSEGVLVIEAKTTGWRGREAWWDNQTGIPDAYAVQVLTQLAVTGLPRAHVVADVAGDFRVVEIHRDLAWEEAVLPMLAQWRTTHIIDDTPPTADPIADWPLFARTWITEPGSQREATPDERKALHGWMQARAEASRAEATAKELRGALRISMGDVQTLTVDGHKAVSLDARGVMRPGPALNPSNTTTERNPNE